MVKSSGRLLLVLVALITVGVVLSQQGFHYTVDAPVTDEAKQDLQPIIEDQKRKIWALEYDKEQQQTAGGEAQYSSYECLDGHYLSSAHPAATPFTAPMSEYGFNIVNRTCLYKNVLLDKASLTFVYFVRTKEELKTTNLPPVSLASRPYDLPIRGWKQKVLRRKISRYYDWRPQLKLGPIPSDAPRDPRHLTYYMPIVAPWNYAHTLFCDLFGLFWSMVELKAVRYDAQVVAVSAHHGKEFPVPDKKHHNYAFDLFSRRDPMYDYALPHAVFRSLLVGTGTKSWSWVTPQYSASGAPWMWYAFRIFIMRVLRVAPAFPETILPHHHAEIKSRVPQLLSSKDAGSSTATAATRAPYRSDAGRKDKSVVRVSMCRKKDKRGVVNYDEAVEFLRKHFGDIEYGESKRRVEFVLESAVGRSPNEQVQMMVDSDVYVCNEGTLATSFFFMPPGSVFVSLPLVYHTPHLHQLNMPRPSEWWRVGDPLRPDPRKNTGGNIDWFPPAIDWVKAYWYDKIPLNETKIQLPLANLRNYMPELNIILREERLVPLVSAAVKWATSTPPRYSVDRPNYSVNAHMCRELLAKTPSLTRSFNTAKCFFSMSWLCEFWTNTHIKWRFLHEKWKLSKHHCGNELSTPDAFSDIIDPRKKHRLSEFLFYERAELEQMYLKTDFNIKENPHVSYLDAIYGVGRNSSSTRSRKESAKGSQQMLDAAELKLTELPEDGDKDSGSATVSGN